VLGRCGWGHLNLLGGQALKIPRRGWQGFRVGGVAATRLQSWRADGSVHVLSSQAFRIQQGRRAIGEEGMETFQGGLSVSPCCRGEESRMSPRLEAMAHGRPAVVCDLLSMEMRLRQLKLVAQLRIRRIA